jgi:ABC-type transport system substrate-binding protein
VGGKPRQSCAAPAGIKGKTIIYANPRTDNLKQLAEFSEMFKQKTGMNFVVKQYRPEEIDAMLLDKKHRRPYNLMIIVTANSMPDQDGFFEFYVGKDKSIDYLPDEVKRLYRKLKQENYPDKKRILAEKLAGELVAQGIVLPLYQTFVRLYYPSNIKNLLVGPRFTETPDIADLRW